VLGRKGGDNPATKVTGKKGHNALSACISASGDIVPPFLIFKGKKNTQNMVDGVPDAAYTHTENGWGNAETFVMWCNHFVAHLKSKGLTKALLVVDGHTDHFSLPAVEILRLANVRMICLPPACTHILQPLDVGYFPALAVFMAKINRKNGGVLLEKHYAKYIHAFNLECQSKAILDPPGLCVNTFKACGLVPHVDPLVHFDASSFTRADIALKLTPTSEAVMKAKAFNVETLALVVDSAIAKAAPKTAERIKERNEKGRFDLSLLAITDDRFVEAALAREEEKAEGVEITKAAAEARALKAAVAKEELAERQWERDQKAVLKMLYREKAKDDEAAALAAAEAAENDPPPLLEQQEQILGDAAPEDDVDEQPLIARAAGKRAIKRKRRD
jgi:hypothetical protein